MALKQINPQLLREWNEKGEILAIWGCHRCFKKIPFYKTDNPLIDSILLSFAKFEKYCVKCKKKKFIKKKVICRESMLLRKYEGIIIEEDDYF